MKRRFLRPLRLMVRDSRAAARFMLQWHKKHLLSYSLATVAALLVVYLCHGLDDEMATFVVGTKAANPEVGLLARALSYYGDFLGFNLVTFAVLQIAGWTLRSRKLMRIAMASIIGCTLAGAAANVVRFATGRPRPAAQMPDGFYGPHSASSMQAFPSAHAATSFGGALPVLMAEPVVGLPLAVVAGGIGWSRIHLNRHHLSDVVASAILALGFSLPLSRWALRASLAVVQPQTHLAEEDSPHVFAPTRQLQ